MSSDRTQSQEYRGIKRIQQACTNCRRKKAKCSGERPVCGYCKRLSQDCQWDGAGARSSTSTDMQDSAGVRSSTSTDMQDGVGSGSDQGTLVYDDGLSVRVAAIESKLDHLMSTLNAFLPVLANRANPHLPISPGDSSRNAAMPGESTPPTSSPVGAFNAGAQRYQSLPPLQVMLSVVDVYFAHVHNQPYAFFHEKNFKQRLVDGALPDYLKFAVLAAALRFSDNPYYNGEYLEAITVYARESWKLLVSSWFATESDPDIYICQSITLLSIVDFTAGRRHPAWLKIGLSIRVAQDLCLMMEPDPSLSYADQEERRRVFWSIYILDKFCSCGRARPAALGEAHCRVQLPCDEITFRNGVWKKMPTLDQLLSKGDSVTDHPGHLALVVIVASVIGRCAQHSIQERSGDDSRLPPWDSKSDFAAIYSVLLQLETQFDMGGSIGEALRRDCLQDNMIDMQIAGPLVFSHAVFHTCQCLLHHPFLLYQQLRRRDIKAPQSFLNRAMQTCREHACANSELMREARSAGCSVFYSFIGYCSTVAGGVHTLFLNNADINIQQRARDCLLSDAHFLEEFSQYWKNGKIMRAILQNLTTQSLSTSTLLGASPQAEGLDSSLVENLWASVDYTTMSQSPKAGSTSVGFNALSPGFNSLFDVGATDLGGFDPNHYLPGPTPQLNEPSPYPSLTFDGMSPITSFFGGPSMNFGG